MNCLHPHRGLFRVVIRDGRTQVTERCLGCGANPRPVAWVPRSEATVPVESLPLLSDFAPRSPAGPLFDEKESA